MGITGTTQRPLLGRRDDLNYYSWLLYAANFSNYSEPHFYLKDMGTH